MADTLPATDIHEPKVSFESKIRKFLSDKYNLVFICIVIFAFSIRMYYFFLTKNQALWYDETEYLSMAKHWAFGLYSNFAPQRVPILPFLAAIIYKLGGGINSIKLFLSILPSVGIVGLFYALGAKMYNKTVGLLAAATTAVFWVSLFWTNRVNTDMLSLFFALCGIYFMWTSLILHENQKHVYYILPMFALSFLTKVNMALIILIISIFLIIYFKLDLFKKKELYISGLATLPIIMPFFIWEKLKFGTFFAFKTSSAVLLYGAKEVVAARPIGWQLLNFVPIFTEKVLFWVFLFGIGILVLNLIIGRDLICKDTKQAANLFLTMLLVIILIYFVFIQRDAEDRWILPIALPIFLAIGVGLEQIRTWLGKINKYLALIAVAGLLIFGAYFELAHADSITKDKIGTYSQEPVAGVWLKEYTKPTDIMLSNNEQVPFTYYTDRKFFEIGENETTFVAIAKDLKPKYYVVTAYYQSPQWTYELPQKYNSSLVPVQAFGEDINGQKIATIIIYEFKNYEF